jgi:DNA-binding NarL/FixJ family response regulator
MRIFLIDCQPIFREGLKNVLSAEHDVTVIGEAENCRAVLEIPARVDLIILDGQLDSISFVNSVQKTRPKGRPPFLLVLTSHEGEHHAIQMLRAGADGYLHKSDSPKTVVNAILKIIRGGKYIPTELAETLIIAMNGDGPARLSNREYEVLSLFASGMTVSEIANHLFLSVKTVSTYRSHLLEKLNLNSNAQLMRYAFSNGILS